MKNITKIAFLIVGLSLSLMALSNESYKKRPLYASMGAQEFFNKHCNRACVAVILGTNYRDRDLSCKVGSNNYKSDPNKYQWLNTIGEFGGGTFKFGSGSYTFINWQTSQILVSIGSIEMDMDWESMASLVSATIRESSKQVKRECESVGGEFKLNKGGSI
jgi:hypothetical protein